MLKKIQCLVTNEDIIEMNKLIDKPDKNFFQKTFSRIYRVLRFNYL